jgi:hypothetical protein
LNVRPLVASEIGLIVGFAVGLLVVYIGLAVFISGTDHFAGVLVLILGLWLMVYVPIVHDRVHRERGEESHALWGRGDRRKPPWWPVS